MCRLSSVAVAVSTKFSSVKLDKFSLYYVVGFNVDCMNPTRRGTKFDVLMRLATQDDIFKLNHIHLLAV